MLNNLQTEEFCKTMCQKYLNTMDREMVLEQDDGAVFHIFLKDEYSYLKDEDKINNENYRNYLDYDYDIYIYDSYQNFYYDYVRPEIENDIEDLGLFDENGNWDFYLSFEELQEMGYGDVVHDVAPDFNYGITLNYFTDKFFKGRDDKSNSSQESPKKDTFDMDK